MHQLVTLQHLNQMLHIKLASTPNKHTTHRQWSTRRKESALFASHQINNINNIINFFHTNVRPVLRAELRIYKIAMVVALFELKKDPYSMLLEILIRTK